MINFVIQFTWNFSKFSRCRSKLVFLGCKTLGSDNDAISVENNINKFEDNNSGDKKDKYI